MKNTTFNDTSKGAGSKRVDKPSWDSDKGSGKARKMSPKQAARNKKKNANADKINKRRRKVGMDMLDSSLSDFHKKRGTGKLYEGAKKAKRMAKKQGLTGKQFRAKNRKKLVDGAKSFMGKIKGKF